MFLQCTKKIDRTGIRKRWQFLSKFWRKKTCLVYLLGDFQNFLPPYFPFKRLYKLSRWISVKRIAHFYRKNEGFFMKIYYSSTGKISTSIRWCRGNFRIKIVANLIAICGSDFRIEQSWMDVYFRYDSQPHWNVNNLIEIKAYIHTRRIVYLIFLCRTRRLLLWNE